MQNTLGALHEAFVTEQQFAGRRAPATLLDYRQAFVTFRRLTRPESPADLTPELVARFFWLLDTRKRIVGRGALRHGVRDSTMATYRAKLGPFFRWLAARGHLASDPLATLPALHVTYEDRQYLSRAEVERIFASLALASGRQGPLLRRRNLALFAILLYTGLRRGEVLSLRVADVNLDRLELTVRGATSKSRRTRIVPLNSKVGAAVADYLAELRKCQPASPYLFPDRTGARAFTPDGLKHVVSNLVRRSGVRFHVHQFRHTFAVNFLSRGGDVARLKQLLGHQDIRMTSGYLRALPTDALRMGVEAVTLETLL